MQFDIIYIENSIGGFSLARNDERGTINLLSRVSTQYEDNDTNETSNARQALSQERAIANGEMNVGLKEDKVGRSFLSPKNEYNQQINDEKNIKDEMPYPGTKEYDEYIKKLDEEYEEDTTDAVSSNRIQAYLILGVVLYFLALCVGYHYTTFEDDVPQITSTERIQSTEYLSQIDDYILAIETLHNETIESIESFTNETMGSSELVSLMKKSNEKIAKQQEELKDITPPESYDVFHSGLIELYSLQASLNSAAINYATSGRSEKEFTVVANINEKYMTAADDFLFKYNKSFY